MHGRYFSVSYSIIAPAAAILGGILSLSEGKVNTARERMQGALEHADWSPSKRQISTLLYSLNKLIYGKPHPSGFMIDCHQHYYQGGENGGSIPDALGFGFGLFDFHRRKRGYVNGQNIAD